MSSVLFLTTISADEFLGYLHWRINQERAPLDDWNALATRFGSDPVVVGNDGLLASLGGRAKDRRK